MFFQKILNNRYKTSSDDENPQMSPLRTVNGINLNIITKNVTKLEALTLVTIVSKVFF